MKKYEIDVKLTLEYRTEIEAPSEASARELAVLEARQHGEITREETALVGRGEKA